jgi:hypothetical protein
MNMPTYIRFAFVTPNHLGEYLRALTFPEHDEKTGEFGCYTTFKVRDDAEIVEPGPEVVWLVSGDESDQLVHAYTFADGDMRVDVAWEWDGDGTLLFRVFENDGASPMVTVINQDCKKNYRWEFIEAVPSGVHECL